MDAMKIGAMKMRRTSRAVSSMGSDQFLRESWDKLTLVPKSFCAKVWVTCQARRRKTESLGWAANC